MQPPLPIHGRTSTEADLRIDDPHQANVGPGALPSRAFARAPAAVWLPRIRVKGRRTNLLLTCLGLIFVAIAGHTPWSSVPTA